MSTDGDRRDDPEAMRAALALPAGSATPARLKTDKELRAERLAEALRANLKRRKQATRAKATAEPDEQS